jgi:hypothetical protein
MKKARTHAPHLPSLIGNKLGGLGPLIQAAALQGLSRRFSAYPLAEGEHVLTGT